MAAPATWSLESLPLLREQVGPTGGVTCVGSGTFCVAGAELCGASASASGPALPIGLCLRHDRVEVERRRLLPRRELHEVLDLLRHDFLHQIHLRDVIDHPIPIGVGVEVGAFERIATQVHDVRHRSFTNGSAHCSIVVRALDREVELIVADPHGHDVAVIAEVDEWFLGLSFTSPVRYGSML